MRFDALLPLLLLAVGGAARLPPSLVQREPPTIVERDLATVTSVISSVESGIASLDSAVKAYSGGDLSPVSKAAASLISTIKSGTSTVSSSGDMSLNDALGLTSVVNELKSDAQTLVNDMIAKKPTFEANSECEAIRTAANSIYSSSQDLIKAIVALVPEAAQSIASQLAGEVTTVLNEATSAYSQGNCTNSGSSSLSGSSSAASSTTSQTASSQTASSPAASSSATSSSSAATTAASSTVASSSRETTTAAPSSTAVGTGVPTSGAAGNSIGSTSASGTPVLSVSTVPGSAAGHVAVPLYGSIIALLAALL